MKTKTIFKIFARSWSIAPLIILSIGLFLGFFQGGVMFFESNRLVLGIEFIMTFLSLIIIIIDLNDFIKEMRKEIG